MSVHVDPVEWFWLVVNTFTLAITIVARRDALEAQAAVRALNGRAREIVAHSNVRRETLRSVVQALLLSAVIPGLFSDEPVTLSWPIVALITVPVVLMLSSALDMYDRRLVIEMIAAEKAEP